MNAPSAAGQPIRHRGPDRLFHWTMACSVVVLIGTAFLPTLGVKFDWVPVHWIAGVVLTALLLFHLWRSFGVHGLAAMIPDMRDVELVRIELLRRKRPAPGSGKYDAWQKSIHAIIGANILVLTATGLLMLVKIDTPLWARDPSIMSGADWGIVYVLHGAASLLLVFLFIIHVYFAFLPEHRAMLKSMINGRGPENARQPEE